jgi:hypothetical protein
VNFLLLSEISDLSERIFNLGNNKNLRRPNLKRKRPEGWRRKTWMLHHDTPAHMLLLVHEFLAKHETTVVPQSPNCPALQIWSLQTFLLFLRLKSSLKGRR